MAGTSQTQRRRQSQGAGHRLSIHSGAAIADEPLRPLALDVGQQLAGYRLLRRIGQGVVGAVFLACNESDDTLVALKIVPLPGGETAAAREAFRRSALTAQRLQHPGIVALHAAGTEGAWGWLAMEPVPGSDLVRYTRLSRLLPEELALRVCARVAQALACAHRQGIVHRDVKPANILVDWPSDTVKLVDFGLARDGDSSQTGTGIVPGSPAYMAPEQLAGAPPTPRGDLYALGATLYQLLTGALPHDGASMGELMRRVAEEPVADPRTLRPGVPPAAAQVVLRLLSRRAAERPADGDDAAGRLLAAAAACQNPG